MAENLVFREQLPSPPPHGPGESPSPVSGSMSDPQTSLHPLMLRRWRDGGSEGVSSLCLSWRAERAGQDGRGRWHGVRMCLGWEGESPVQVVGLDLQTAHSPWEGDGVFEREQERGKEIMFSQCSYLKQTLNKDWDEPG